MSSMALLNASTLLVTSFVTIDFSFAVLLIKIHESLYQDEQGIMKTNFNHNRQTGCCLKEDRRYMAEIWLIRRKSLFNQSINRNRIVWLPLEYLSLFWTSKENVYCHLWILNLIDGSYLKYLQYSKLSDCNFLIYTLNHKFKINNTW